jgi:hypothetical protein
MVDAELPIGEAISRPPQERAPGETAMAKITRTNPEGISKPFSNYSHVVTAEGAQKLVF